MCHFFRNFLCRFAVVLLYQAEVCSMADQKLHQLRIPRLGRPVIAECLVGAAVRLTS